MDDKRLDEILNEYVNSTSAGQNTDLKKYRNKQPKVLPARTNKKLAISLSALALVFIIAIPIIVSNVKLPDQTQVPSSTQTSTSTETSQGIESGFIFESGAPIPSDFFAYKSDKTEFDLNDVTLTFYYGGLFSSGIEYEKENLRNIPEFELVFINYNSDTNIEERVVVKKVEENFVDEKYQVTLVNDIETNTKRVEFNHCEELTVPAELFIGESGRIVFLASGKNTLNSHYSIDGYCLIYYEKKGDKVILKTIKGE